MTKDADDAVPGPTYKVRIPTPSPIKDFIEAVQGTGEILSITDAYIEFTLVLDEGQGDYELANVVRDVESELNGVLGYAEVTLPRPEPVEPIQVGP